MPRFFNTAGPVNTAMHYCLPPLSRIDLDEVMLLLEQQKYFVLHAPRQSGKTSLLHALQAKLNTEGHYHCVYANVEVAQGYRENVAPALTVIMRELAEQAERLGDQQASPILHKDVERVYGRREHFDFSDALGAGNA